MLGRENCRPVGVVFGLGLGLFGAWTLAFFAPSRGGSTQLEKPQQATDKPVRAGSAPAFSKNGKPASAKVESGPFQIEVTAAGVFESDRMTEVSIRPKAWTMPLVVERAVELGTPVKKGDILLELDRSKIEKAIQDHEIEIGLVELALKQAQEELPVLEKNTVVDLAAAERSKAQADEDLKRLREIDRPQAERSTQFNVKRTAEYLEYSKEELRQLEKMYRSKDLTEETEEIILRRQRFQVENSEFFLKEAELQRDQALKVDLPRREERAVESATKMAIELAKARAVLPLTVNQKRLALAKLKYDHTRSAERLADLRLDRDAMVVHSPADGIVYYGRCNRGHWSPAAMAANLRKGGIVAADEPFMTVAAPSHLSIRASIDEKDLSEVLQPKELNGLITPSFSTLLRMPGRLVSVATVAREPGKFEAVVSVEIGQASAAIKPGMTCSIKFVTYRSERALTVPSVAVFEDDSAGKLSNYVYLAQPGRDGKYPKRPVKSGRSSAGRTEILEGLSAGDEVLIARP
jgi:multidrug efflux pump subunit AcrA (membrane-fusion protein)